MFRVWNSNESEMKVCKIKFSLKAKRTEHWNLRDGDKPNYERGAGNRSTSNLTHEAKHDGDKNKTVQNANWA